MKPADIRHITASFSITKRKLPGSCGFTLIELMIAVVVIGVLAAIAYPTYTSYITKTNRTAAKTKLLDAAAKLETYFLDNRTYATDLTNIAYGSASPYIDNKGQEVAQADSIYQISVVTPTAGCAIANCYKLQAVVTTGSFQVKDTDCKKFFLDSRGLRSAENSSAADSTSTCW